MLVKMVILLIFLERSCNMTHKWDEQFKGIMAYPDCADEYLELICEIAIGYDGYSTIEGLESLIDEMAEYAKKARKCLQEHKIFTDEDATEASFNTARDNYEAWLTTQSKLQKAINDIVDSSM